jgi:hypothetical protein
MFSYEIKIFYIMFLKDIIKIDSRKITLKTVELKIKNYFII